MKYQRNRSLIFRFVFLSVFLTCIGQVSASSEIIIGGGNGSGGIISGSGTSGSGGLIIGGGGGGGSPVISTIVINTQPVARQVATLGDNVTFIASASGSGDLSYQWFHNGIAIAGGTADTLTINNVKYGDTGAYLVSITDSNGVATSTPAFLNVLQESTAEFAWGVLGPSVPTGGINGVVSIAAGGSHDLALKSDGTVVAWGDNGCGQCNIPNGLDDVVAIDAGTSHSLALKSDGTVAAWGDNSSGQCTIPSGLISVVAVAAGYKHSLALKSDGTVVAWGDNSSGQCNSSGLNSVVAVAGGGKHSLALKRDGTVVAWGNSWSGQSFVPPGLNNVVAIAAGQIHSLALKSDGTVVAWGDNYYGQTRVPAGLSGGVAIAAGGNHCIALKSDGTVVGWGMSVYNQIAFPPDLSGVIAIAGGENHSLVLKTVPLPAITTQPAAATINTGDSATFNVTATGDYLGYQWRKNGVPIDNGTSATYTIPYVQAADSGTFDVLISNPAGTVTSNSVALTVIGPTILTQPVPNQVAALGGTATLTASASGSGELSYQWFHNGLPVAGGTSAVLTLSNVKYTDTGAYQVKITDSTGVATSTVSFVNVLMDSVGVYAWGDNSYGQCGVPTGLNGAVAIAGGGSQTLVLKSDGTVVAWGHDYFGDYGEGVAPAGLSNVVAISAGAEHSLALKADGTVTGWGSNSWGQSSAPAGLNGVIAISAGDYHSLALKADGTVIGWGEAFYGQSTPPVGLNGVIAIAAGCGYSLALKSDGTVVAWGLNNYGVTSVPSGLNGVIAIAAGGNHALALKLDGTVVAWGYNNNGQCNVPTGLSGVIAIAAGGNQSVALKSDGSVVVWGSGSNLLPALSGVVAITAGTARSLALAVMPKPSISTQPLSSTINTGEHATFGISATGEQLCYQWRKNGIPISGATNAVYALPNVQKDDQGTYDIVVSNPGGSVTTSPATLTVVGPLLTLQPAQRQVLSKGEDATFSVSATGTGDLSYQWYHNGLAIAGGTYSILTVSNIKYTDSGAYQVKVTDSTGYSLSSAGHLNVNLGCSAVIAWLCNPNNSGQNNVPAGLNDSVAIAAGGSHCLALESDGTVVAWGNNDYGQTSIPSGLSDVVAIAAGDYSSLALKSDGTVVGWGLGAPAAGLSGIVAISVNGSHNMVLKSDGTIVEWGGGPLTIGPTYIPIPPGLTGVAAIAPGGSHSLVLKPDGTVIAWGDNSYGQCIVPDGLSGVIAIAAGWAQSFALKSDGTVVAWGNNGGNLCSIPDGLTGVTAIAVGCQSLALKSDGTVVAWGTNVWGMGAVPDGVSSVVAIAGGGGYSLLLEEVQRPVVVVDPVSTSAHIGRDATFNVTASGNTLAYQWRKNGTPITTGTGASLTLSNVQPSDEGSYDVIVTNSAGSVTSNAAFLTVTGLRISIQPASRQVAILGGTATLSISAAGVGLVSYQWYHNGCPIADGTASSLTFNSVQHSDVGAYQVTVTDSAESLTSTLAFLNIAMQPSKVVAWGNYFGNRFDQSTIPAGLVEVTAVAGASYQSLALKSDGTVVGWGDDWDGAVCPPIGLNNAVAIAAGYNYSLALKADGTVVGWGQDAWQQCTFAKGLTNVIAISAQGINSMALKSDGTVVAWGATWYGYPANWYVMNTVPFGLSGVVAIAAGDSHSLALKSDGTVVAWGDNSSGQVSVPSDLKNVIAIAAGYGHSLALKSDGTVVAWGFNGYGQASVPTGLSGVVAIAAGAYHSMALKADGTVVSWGDVSQGAAGAIAIAGGFYHSLAIQNPATPPANIIASNSDPICLGQVHLTWPSVFGAIAYQIFRSTSLTGDKEAVSTWQSGTEFYDTPPTRATPYYYWVVATSDPANTNISGFSSSAIGSAALNARDVFSNWMTTHGIAGLPEDRFASVRNGGDLASGFEYAFGTNRQNNEPPISIVPFNGSLAVGVLKQADETLPYVNLAVKCSNDLQDWSYPLVPVADPTGLPGNRTWFQPQGSPAKVFFRLESSLKPSP